MFFFGGRGNYPAGAHPWSGTPTSVDPSVRYLTPGQAIPAQYVNWIFQTMSEAAASAMTVPAANWRTTFIPTLFGSSTAFTAAKWDDAHSQWLIGVCPSAGTGNIDVVSTKGAAEPVSGYDFAPVDNGAGVASFGKVTDCLFDGTNYFMAGIKQSDSSFHVFRCAGGGAWVDVFNDAGHTYTQALLSIHAAKIVLTYSTSGALMGGASADVGNGAGGNWTNGFSIGVNSGFGALVADSGVLMVTFAVVSAGTAAIYMTSPDGITWTPRSSAFMVNAGEFASAFTYNKTSGMFVLCTDATDLNTRTYNSQDGLAWTLVSTFASISNPTSMACTGLGCIVMTNNDGTNAFVNYTVDDGQTWRRSIYLTALSGFTPLTLPQISASKTGLFLFTNGFARFSHNVGLSSVVV